jgi:serine phosphatase RsbU (regulator of sigma subunit)
MLEAVLEGMPLPFSRTNAAVAKLELIGVVKERAGHCAIRNRIYRRAMEGHQTSELRLQRAIISDLNREMLATTNLESLLHVVAAHLHHALQNRAVVIFTKGFQDPGYTAAANVGITEPIIGNVRFESGCRLLANLEKAFTPQECDLPDEERLRLRDLRTVLIVPILLRDEAIGFLSLGAKFSGEVYDAHEVKFVAAVANQTAVGVERFRLRVLQQDAERALAIQRNLLPKDIPQISGYQMSGAWYPARLASGDYYDVLTFGEDKFGLCIGDVVGKGLPAAMLMSNLQAHVRASASETMAPSGLCERINRLTAKNIEPGKFITFFYALVDGRSRRISYANAGHNPPILLRSTGEIVRLQAGGALLGVFPDWVYLQEETELSAGDRLVLFTDGVSEAQDSSNDEFGEERLIEVLTRHRSRNALEMQEAVIQAVSDFSRGDLYDDVTVLVMAVS